MLTPLLLQAKWARDSSCLLPPPRGILKGESAGVQRDHRTSADGGLITGMEAAYLIEAHEKIDSEHVQVL